MSYRVTIVTSSDNPTDIEAAKRRADEIARAERCCVEVDVSKLGTVYRVDGRPLAELIKVKL